jgi:hypothetical protein
MFADGITWLVAQWKEMREQKELLEDQDKFILGCH